MPLPSCECVEGMPLASQLNAIYCALLQILENGGGGGSVTLADISDMSDFWKATLSGTPAADQVFGTDGAGVFTTFAINNAGQNLLNIVLPAGESFIMVTDVGSTPTREPAAAAEFLALGDVGLSSTQTPVNSITTVNGIVTALS